MDNPQQPFRTLFRSKLLNHARNEPCKGHSRGVKNLRCVVRTLPTFMVPWHWRLGIAWIVLIAMGGSLHSQVPDSFNPGADNIVHALTFQRDGEILVGGTFSKLGGQARKYIGQLNPNGSVGTSLSIGANNIVNALVVQPDGKVLVGGTFTTLEGYSRLRIGRLNADLSLETNFTASANNTINAIALQSDGKILVGGTFTNLSGFARNRLGRLNADGTVDLSFDPNVNSAVYGMTIQSDGYVLIGGTFTSIAGVTATRIARLSPEGNLDPTFTASANSTVGCLAVQPDGKILVGGNFTNLSGVACSRIGRLNSNGSLESSINAASFSPINSLAIQADGKIIVAGSFSSLSGQPSGNLGRLNADCSYDTTFNAAASGLAVYSSALQPDGKLLVGGLFTSFAAVTRTNIARASNTVAATETLTFSGGAISWTRSGSSPEISFVTFDASTNGVDWFSIGAGTRAGNAWVVSTTGLPGTATIRARGRVASGLYNGSGWFTEAFQGPPAFFKEPQSRTNLAGTTATFSALAGGGGSVMYQWQKNGTNLIDGPNVAGAQSPVLSLINVTGVETGTYRCIASNASGTATSRNATLFVIDPVINTQPTDVSVNAGQTATLTVAASGSALMYQWRFNGSNVSIGTSSSLVLPNAQMVNAGLYDVVLTNAFGSITSSVVMLSVNGALPDSWNPSGFGYSDYVRCFAIQPDGKIVVGGEMNQVAGQSMTRYGRLNTDGTKDSSFVSPGWSVSTSGSVFNLSLLRDGRVVLGGNFSVGTGSGTSSRQVLQRLNLNGTLDLPYYAGFDYYSGNVSAQALQLDGKLIAGGSFTKVHGQARTNLVRVNADGSLDASFSFNVSYLDYAGMSSVALQPDGKILIGGGFTNLAGQNRNFIARLNSNGTLDTAFNPNLDDRVTCVALQADGKILAGGFFKNADGQPCNHLVRLYSNGILDGTFNIGSMQRTANYTQPVHSLLLQTDGKVLVAGSFTKFGDRTRNYLARIYPNGSIDPTFDPKMNAEVQAVALQADGKILVSGPFQTIGGQNRTNIVRLENTEPATVGLTFNGSTITWLRGGSSPEVWTTKFEISTNNFNWIDLGQGQRIPGGWQIVSQPFPPDATIRATGFLVAGPNNGSASFLESFIGRPVVQTQPMARTNAPATTATFSVVAVGVPPLSYQWLKNGVPMTPMSNVTGIDSPVLTLNNVFGNNAGEYSVVVSNPSGSTTSLVARLTVLDPMIVTPPTNQSAFKGQSVSLTLDALGTTPLNYQWYKDGSIVPGATRSALSLPDVQRADLGSYYVAITNQYGNVDSIPAVLTVDIAAVHPVALGAEAPVYSCAIQPDHKILVGGAFLKVKGENRSRLARLNADHSIDTTFGDLGLDGPVYALAVQPDRRIIVAGAFSSISGLSRTNLVRLHSDGSVDTTFNPKSIDVGCLALQKDGKILIGNSGTNVVRLNADGTEDNSFKPKVFGSATLGKIPTVRTLAVQPDGKILVGGNFTNLCDEARHLIGRLNPDGTLDSTFAPGASGGGVSWYNSAVHALAIQPDNKILVGGIFTHLAGIPRAGIGRLNPDGTLDTSFEASVGGPIPDIDAWPHVRSIALQSDGKILVGGFFGSLNGQSRTNLGRLKGDGTVDLTLNPGVKDGFWSYTDYGVNTLALQWNGGILIGGRFEQVRGQPSVNLAAIINTDPAGHSFEAANGVLTWHRRGPSPEVWRTTFETSQDGTNWTYIGEGVRASGSWQLAGVSPTGNLIRVRGFVAGSRHNGSGWLVESVFPKTVSIVEGSPGIFGNKFGFDITGPLGEINFIESSTDMVEWLPLTTVSLDNQPTVFRDTVSSNALQRFYRLHNP